MTSFENWRHSGFLGSEELLLNAEGGNGHMFWGGGG
jgi:hypothetical protein